MRSGPRPKAKNKIAGLCKGSTTDSDSVCEGSNPSPAAKRKGPGNLGNQGFRGFFVLFGKLAVSGFPGFLAVLVSLLCRYFFRPPAARPPLGQRLLSAVPSISCFMLLFPFFYPACWPVPLLAYFINSSKDAPKDFCPNFSLLIFADTFDILLLAEVPNL